MNGGIESRIGVFGGTFNPVHTGHMIVAQSALETFELEKVVFMPCASPPHKPVAGLADGRHRRAMLTAATECNLQFEVSDIELARGGVSYAIDTLRQLRGMYPDAEIFFIIGGDTLRELHQWKDIYELLPLCRFATFSRPGSPLGSLCAEDLKLGPPWPERLLQDVRPGRQIDISSSDIRYRIAEAMSIRYLVPAEVEMYIAEHGLYGD